VTSLAAGVVGLAVVGGVGRRVALLDLHSAHGTRTSTSELALQVTLGSRHEQDGDEDCHARRQGDRGPNEEAPLSSSAPLGGRDTRLSVVAVAR
jgi:hypothetical protein